MTHGVGHGVTHGVRGFRAVRRNAQRMIPFAVKSSSMLSHSISLATALDLLGRPIHLEVVGDLVAACADAPVVEKHEPKGSLGGLRVSCERSQVGRQFPIGEKSRGVHEPLDLHELIVATEFVVLHTRDEVVAECGPGHEPTASRSALSTRARRIARRWVSVMPGQ